MTFSRANPSPRYTALLAQYRTMHAEGDKERGFTAEQTFPGKALPGHAATIKLLIDHLKVRTVLDYGAGKGEAYRDKKITIGGDAGKTFNNIREFWGVDVTCYDPAYTPFSTLPQGKFDGVISTDVMEHCPEEDIPWIVDEMFGYATKFLFATVATYPAKKKLPGGENAHATLKPAAWWTDTFAAASKRHGNIPFLLMIEDVVMKDGQNVRIRKQAGSIKLG